MGRKPKGSSIVSFFRPLFTVIVLSAFVLGISFFVKTLATSDSKKLLSMVNPVLVKLNIADSKIGEVAGEFVTRVSQSQTISDVTPKQSGVKSANVDVSSFKVGILSDSHDDVAALTTAVEKLAALRVSRTFFLGDYTNFGELPNLKTAKTIMDSSGLDYESLPGDHDLYKSVGPENFIEIFGKNHFVKIIEGIKFVGLDNSANFTAVPPEILTWFEKEIVDADFVLLSQPLYHPNFNVVMGIVGGEENVAIRAQAVDILSKIRQSNVKAIIAGDQHMSSVNVDPVKTSLSHIVVGALTSERNLQTPRFSVLYVYQNNTYKIEDVLLK